jgi:hypothetical protein
MSLNNLEAHCKHVMESYVVSQVGPYRWRGRREKWSWQHGNGLVILFSVTFLVHSLPSKSLLVHHAKGHRLEASRSRYRTRKVLKRKKSYIQRIGGPKIPGGMASSRVASTPSTAPRLFSIALGWIQPNAELGPREGERLRVHCRRIRWRYQIIRELNSCSMLARPGSASPNAAVEAS